MVSNTTPGSSAQKGGIGFPSPTPLWERYSRQPLCAVLRKGEILSPCSQWGKLYLLTNPVSSYVWCSGLGTLDPPTNPLSPVLRCNN